MTCFESAHSRFVADDPRARVRHFVVQGTDCLDSWKTNLNFEPTEFECPQLRTKVHRGVYESAIVLYEIFAPLVKEHLRSENGARVAFTGHSLGGSLATVLALMLKHRGVITHARQLDGVITFGTAAVFCEAAAAEAAASGAPAPPRAVALDSTLLLERLGLPRSSISNVMTTKDIVPRAFACDYKAVAAVLRSHPTYAQHHGLLASNRKLLYSFAGQQLMLQPCSRFAWVTEDAEPANLLFPPGPGLWVLAPPTTLSSLFAKMFTRQARDAARDAARAAQPNRASPLDNVPEAESVADALLHCMDKPHPLTILGDPRAYGAGGAISRYHNPDNYAMAVREVAVRSASRRVALLFDLVRFLAQEQSALSGTAWRRWLADWRESWTILQQTIATVGEATSIVLSQVQSAAVASRRSLLARQDVAQTLRALETNLEAARAHTVATTSATTSVAAAAATRGLSAAAAVLRAQVVRSQERPASSPAAAYLPSNSSGPEAVPGAAASGPLSAGGATVAAPVAAPVAASQARPEDMRRYLPTAPELGNADASSSQQWLPKMGRALATLSLLPLTLANGAHGPTHVADLPNVPSANPGWGDSLPGSPPALPQQMWEAGARFVGAATPPSSLPGGPHKSLGP